MEERDELLDRIRRHVRPLPVLGGLRDESLEDTDNLPPLGVIAAEIVEDLQAALAEFAELAESLQGIGEPQENAHLDDGSLPNGLAT